MDKFHKKTLARKMSSLLLFGFIIALIIFSILFWAINKYAGDYFFTSDFIYNVQEPYVKSFQEYITKYHISSDDIDSLRDWISEENIQHLLIEKDGELLYDSNYTDLFISKRTQSEFQNNNWPFFHTVTFSDGEADIYVYANNYELKYYISCYAIAAIFSMTIWILFFVLGVRREVKYIQELNENIIQIGKGNLQTNIRIKGEDEIASLASGLDQMRLALIQKEKTEKKLKEEQDKLVVGMAHDLRTPLTSLMAFLEISKKQSDLPSKNLYINKAYNKATQIRELSNQMFDFFLIHTEQKIQMEEPETVEYALGEYLSELCAILEMSGYMISIEHLTWEPVSVSLCLDYMGRIIDNLTSNIKKYANPDIPIQLSSKYDEKYIHITLQNQCRMPNQYVQGTGIGVKNMKAMMKQMKGCCYDEITKNLYTITLSFPLKS